MSWTWRRRHDKKEPPSGSSKNAWISMDNPSIFHCCMDDPQGGGWGVSTNLHSDVVLVTGGTSQDSLGEGWGQSRVLVNKMFCILV